MGCGWEVRNLCTSPSVGVCFMEHGLNPLKVLLVDLVLHTSLVPLFALLWGVTLCAPAASSRLHKGRNRRNNSTFTSLTTRQSDQEEYSRRFCNAQVVFTLYLWSILFVLVSISRGPGRKVIYAHNCDKHLQNVDPQCKWLDRNLITQCTYQASEDTFIMLVLLPWGEVLPMTNIRPYGWFVVVSGFSTIEFH